MAHEALMKRNKLTVCVILCVVMIMSCSDLKTVPTNTPSKSPNTRTAGSPSLTPSAPMLSSLTPSPVISTYTPTLVPTSTWTPLPTYSAQQAGIKIKELLDTNGGCNLPCWWGITSNKTLWPEALHFLNPFLVDMGQGGSKTYYKDGKKHYITNFGVYFDVPGMSKQGRIYLGVQDDVVTNMSIFPPVTENKYHLHELLALLGPPSRVFLNAQSSSPISELPPAVLTLDYSDVGIWASYGYIPTVEGASLVICAKSIKETTSVIDYENLGGRLELFDPADERDGWLTIEEYAEMWGGFTPKKLEDVTDMTIESFYNTFIQPGSCFKTAADLWP